MSELDKLLDGFDVQMKSLKEIYKFQYGKGNTIPKTGGEYPVYGSNGIVGTHSEFNSEDSPVIGHIGAYAGIVNWGIGKHFVTYNGVICKLINENIDSRYAYHQLLNQDFNSMAKNSSHPFVSYKELYKVQIPIPCPDNPEKSLKIQKEIVRILDTFTELTKELTKELTTELTTHKKQFEYYRENLIVNSNSRKEQLGDISDIYLGLTYTPKYIDKGVKFISAKNTSKDFLDLEDVKYISKEEYNKSTSNAKPKRGDVLFTRVGSNLGHPVIVDTDEDLCMFVSLGYIRVNSEKVLNSYIKHWMNTDLFWSQVRRKTHGAAKVNLNTGWLKKFEVLLPPLKEQERIVTILDKFDILNTSISEVLPKEIELRKKQYEYYREELLTFPKAAIDL